jgi:general secretion pathway protein K
MESVAGNKPRKRAEGAESRQQGSALILVLWVIGLLSMLVASFAFEAHIESRLTSFYRDRTKAEYLARSGLDIAELLVAKSSRLHGVERDEAKAGSDIWYDPAMQLAKGGTVSFVHDLAEAGVGQGLIRLSITPEPARRNVNRLIDQTQASDETWERIFDVGGIPEEMWPTLIDSFYDWTDADDAPRPDGAETDDYYANLDKPYRVRNGPLDTVGELALIKGFTQDILQGGTLSTGMFESDKVQMSGIADMLTTYGDGKVNINAASVRVLQTLPDVDAEMAATIVNEREMWVDGTGEERKGFSSTDEMLALIPDFPPAAVAYLTTTSKEFRITSTGDLNGVLHTIWCIVRFTDDRFTVLRWREDD